MEELFYNKYRKEGDPIGHGASSEVWRVTDVQTGIIQALKIYSPLVAMEDDGIEMLKHEFKLMANIFHQNLLRPLYFDIWDKHPFLVLPFCANGNLKKKIGLFTEKDGWQLLHDVASGLACLHKQDPPIIHQDIKPENILIADDGSYMLTDFGVSAHARATMRATMSSKLTSAGTMAYMAPEKFSPDKTPITASDIWSLGAMAYEMLTGEVPFTVGTVEGGILQKNGADIPELPKSFSKELRDLITKCLSLNPWDRPRALEIELMAQANLQRLYGGGGRQTRMISSSRKWLWTTLSAVVVIGLIVGGVFLLPHDNDPTPPQPKPYVPESREQRLEMARQMMLSDSMSEARQGWDSLAALSNEGFCEATFLRSRILFDNPNPSFGQKNSDWSKMRKKIGVEANNAYAHRLLELAVRQDTESQNIDALYELGFDYYKGKERGYEALIDSIKEDKGEKEIYRIALSYFTKYQALEPNNTEVAGIIKKLNTVAK